MGLACGASQIGVRFAQGAVDDGRVEDGSMLALVRLSMPAQRVDATLARSLLAGV